MSIISVPQLRERLKLDAQEDAKNLVTLRDDVVALWEQMTNRKWVIATGFVELFSPRSDVIRTVWLRLLPVTTLTSIEERADGADTWTTLTATQYELIDLATGELVRIGGPWDRRVRVTYSGGYAEGTAPVDVREALSLQAEFTLRRLGGESVGMRSQSQPGGGQTNFEEAWLHPTFKRLAAIYRRRA